MTGKVFLVGAGCGTAEDITLRALHALQTCDTVVWDALIDPGLLDFAPQAERRYVGKRSGVHSLEQSAINRLLVGLALEGKTVVRLKGGDPYVFGRGGEEAQALLSAGIPFEVISGISSAIAIPAAAGIPVTHRGVSGSVHIVTAHSADSPDGLPADLDRLAGLSGTLVFLMGLSRLEKLAEKLISAGMPETTPAAVLSGGNAPCPATVRGTLGDISKMTREAGVQPPAVILIGGTAGMNLSCPLPLTGVRVGVTGTDSITGKLRSLLTKQGAEVFCPLRSRVIPLTFSLYSSGLLDNSPRWLVFTSPNGVRVFLQAMKQEKTDLRQFARSRFAVTGPGTADALQKHCILADFCPEIHTTRALALGLRDLAAPEEEIVLLRSLQSTQELPALLKGCAHVRDIPIYETCPDIPEPSVGRAMLSRMDYLTFGSAGGVTAFFDAFGEIPEKTVCACIGPVTAAALRKRWQGTVLEAETIHAEGLADAILRHHREVRGRPQQSPGV